MRCFLFMDMHTLSYLPSITSGVVGQGGGPSFGNLDDSPPSSLGEGVDVLKLQVALNCRDRSRNSILGEYPIILPHYATPKEETAREMEHVEISLYIRAMFYT